MSASLMEVRERLRSLQAVAGAARSEVSHLASELEASTPSTLPFRKVAESIVMALEGSRHGASRDLCGSIDALVRDGVVDRIVGSHLHLLRLLGNKDAHVGSSEDTRTIGLPDLLAGAWACVAALEWFAGREVVSGALAYVVSWWSAAVATELRRPLEHGRSYVVGRGASSDLIIEGDEVSRRHCVLDLRGGVLVLRDLGSTHGTFLDGRRIREERVPPTQAVEVRLGRETRVQIVPQEVGRDSPTLGSRE